MTPLKKLTKAITVAGKSLPPSVLLRAHSEKTDNLSLSPFSLNSTIADLKPSFKCWRLWAPTNPLIKTELIQSFRLVNIKEVLSPEANEVQKVRGC